MSITVDETAVKRIKELRKEQNNPNLYLRITVDGGGCSGFQYLRKLTDQLDDGDQIFDDVFVTDKISIPFMSGSTIRFESKLIGADFVVDNPNAASGCGCGTSFSI